MGTEYYLIKPEKEEIFYLGKHFEGFNKIKNTTYCKSLDQADYPAYEDWDEFFWDTLRTNWYYFLDCDLNPVQISNVIYQMYEWCVSDKVILDNDCSDTAKIWSNWKETSDITSILEGIHNALQLSEESFINELLEENGSLLFENPSYKRALMGVTTDGRAVYDYALMIDELVEQDSMNYEEAVEFIDYNTIGSLPSEESKYPIIIQERKN